MNFYTEQHFKLPKEMKAAHPGVKMLAKIQFHLLLGYRQGLEISLIKWGIAFQLPGHLCSQVALQQLGEFIIIDSNLKGKNAK